MKNAATATIVAASAKRFAVDTNEFESLFEVPLVMVFVKAAI
jgi:hypothetical protein